MTREEAIQVLKSMKSEESYNALIDLCNIAIEALSAPSGDVISRADAIDAIPDTTADMFENCRNCKLLDREQVIDILSALPSAEYSKPLQTTLNNDLISRADAIKAIAEHFSFDDGCSNIYKDIDYYKGIAEHILKNVPSADAVSREDYHNLLMASNDIDRALRQYQAKEETDAEPKWGCTANFVAEQLNKLEDMTVKEKVKLIQDLLGVELKEENLNYEYATLVDIKEPLKIDVVRCKDCYYAEDDITHMYCVYFGHKVYGDDYCSNAVERKGGEEE